MATIPKEDLEYMMGGTFLQEANIPGESEAPPLPEIPVPETDTAPPHANTIDIATQEDPNEVIETIRLGQELEMPYQQILKDPKEARRLKYLQDLGIVDMPTEAPGTTKWLENQQNAAVASDDIPTLIEIEKALEAQKGMDAYTFANAGKSWVISLAKMWPQFQMMMHGASKDTVAYRVQEKGRREAEARGDAEAVAYYDELERTAEETFQRNKLFVEEADRLQAELAPKDAGILVEGAVGGFTMAADMLPGLIVSAATRGRVNPTLTYLATKTGLESYSTGIMEGLEHHEAMRYGGIDMAIEVATERLPVKYMERIFGELSKDGIKSSLKKWMVTEAGTEQLATLGQSLNAVAFDLDEELANAQTLSERLAIQGRRQAVTLISTIIGGGGMSLGLTAADRILNKETQGQRAALRKAFERTSSENSLAGLDRLFSLAQQSRTNERADEFFQDFLGSVAPDQNIYVTADAIQEMEEIPPEIQQQLDGSGADVEMPIGQFMSLVKQNEEVLVMLRDHVKAQPHLQTRAELEQDTDTGYIRSVLEQAAADKQAKTEADEIYEEIVEGLKATGRQSELTSRQSAALLPALITTQYQDLKSRGITNPDGSEITIRQLYEDMGFRIARPSEEVGRTDYMTQPPPPVTERDVGVTTADRVSNVQAALVERTEAGDMPGTSKIMNDQSGSEQDYALVETSLGKQGLRIDSIIASRTGMGNGRAALNMLMGLADQQQVAMTVNPKKFKRMEGLTDQELEEWFARHGFVKDGKMMTREAAPEMPGLLYDQAFGNITITETVIDEAGDLYDIEQPAQALWEAQQERFTVLQQLRGCVNATTSN